MAYLQRNWPEILKEISECGLTLKEYSEVSDIPYSTLCSHLRKRKEQTLVSVTPEVTTPLGFVRIEPEERIDKSNSGVRIRIGRYVIEVDESFSKRVLERVLEVVHAGS